MGCARALAFLAGVILLFPAACFFLIGDPRHLFSSEHLIGLVIGVVALLFFALSFLPGKRSN